MMLAPFAILLGEMIVWVVVVELGLGGLHVVKVHVKLCMRRINLAWLYAYDTSSCCLQGFPANFFGWKSMICYNALLFTCSTSVWYPNPKGVLPTFSLDHQSYTMQKYTVNHFIASPILRYPSAQHQRLQYMACQSPRQLSGR